MHHIRSEHSEIKCETSLLDYSIYDSRLPFFFDWPKFAISRLSSTANTESLELSQRVEARMLTHSVTFYTHSSS